jgi:hypothetical protein
VRDREKEKFRKNVLKQDTLLYMKLFSSIITPKRVSQNQRPSTFNAVLLRFVSGLDPLRNIFQFEYNREDEVLCHVKTISNIQAL